MDIVFLIYGLSFLGLALVLTIWPKENSEFALARLVRWLAAFALVHGLLEWTDLWRVVRGDTSALAFLRPFVLLSSYVLLLEFGRRLARESIAGAGGALPAPARALLDARIHLPLLAIVAAGSVLGDDFVRDLTIWSRYLFGFPGSTLAGVAFLLYCRRKLKPVLPEREFGPIHRACRIAGAAFVAYGVFGGLVVPAAPWAPASWLNHDNFLALTQIPVQIFRAASAVTIAFSVSYILRIFYLEGRQRLQVSLDEAEIALIEVRHLSRHNRLLLESVGEGIFGLDRNGNTTFINAAALTMLGYAEDEVIGRSIHKLAHHTRPDGTPCKLDECATFLALQDGLARHVAADLFWRKDGTSFPVEYRTTPIHDEGRRMGAVVVFQDITERRRAEQAQTQARAAAEHANNLLKEAVDSIPQGFTIYDPDDRLFHCNETYRDFYDTSRDLIVAGAKFEDIIRRGAERGQFQEARGRIDDWVRERVDKHQRANGEMIEQRLDDGTWLLIMEYRTPSGYIVGSRIDITERKRAEAELRLAHEAFTNAREAIMVTDEKANILDVNPAFCRITGYDRDEVVGKNPRMLHSGRQDAAFYQDMWRTLTGKGSWEGELWNRRKNGEFYVQQAKISAVRDSDDSIIRYVAISSDITQLKETQGRVEHMAYYDPLTNLPNRTLLADRLKQAIAQADRRNRLLAICYLDLDGFKPVNDTWGHDTGDLLLIDVARRLQISVRAGDTVARLGGDEFVVLLGDASNVHEVEQAVRRILTAIASPFRIGPIEVALTASMGVTIYPADGQDPDTLIRHADQAMYAAKQAGKNGFHLFDPENDRRVKEHRDTILRVEQGLAAGEFCLHYQPKVNMRLGTVIGVEALIRWQHPEQGLLMPAAFLPAVESSDCCVTLGQWVLREALRQVSAWAVQGLQLPVSVNISARHLQQKDFVTTLSRALAEFPDVKPEWLELEILETTAMDDIDAVSRIIADCATLGVSFALDDFGTGYSSLTYFRRLPTRMLKVDQSFVRDMLDDADDLAIVEGVIGLAQTFQRQVVAEGVETIEHGIPLLQFGCELAQGYGIARPMPADQVPDWVRNWKLPPAWDMMASVHWSKEDFPLLLAEIHHRRWIERMVAIFEGRAEAEQAPPLSAHQCRFGQWLYGIGKRRYGEWPIFLELEPIHDRVHRRGAELLALLHTDPESARMRAGELGALRDELVERLEGLKIQVSLGGVGP